MATQTISATETAPEAVPDPYQQYQWRQSSNATWDWERDIDEAERFYTSFCRTADDPEKTDFAITGSASFSVSTEKGADTNLVVEGALRKAWARLRRECPGLASWIQYDAQTETWKRVCSNLVDSGKQDEWLAASFRVIETDLSDAEWFNSEPPVFKLPTLFLLKPATVDTKDQYRASVFFRSPHDTIDGHGILQLLDRLFELTASVYKGTGTIDDSTITPNESTLLPPPMRVATAITPKPSDSQKQYFRETMAKNGAAALGLPPLGLPTSASGTASRKQRVYTTLSKPLTSQLLSRCKEQGFTITHAVSAAVVLALQQIQEVTEPKDMRYYMQALMSVRHMCPEPHASLANAASNYHMIATGGMGVDVKVGDSQENEVDDLEKEFSEIAHKFKEYYVSARPSIAKDNRDDLDLAPLTWSLVTPQKAPGDAPPGDTSSSAPGAVGISSLGNIASLVKADRAPISLTDVWVAGEGSGSSIPIMLGGYDGKIEVSAIFDEAFFGKTYMKDFQRNVLKLAAQGLRLTTGDGLEAHIE